MEKERSDEERENGENEKERERKKGRKNRIYIIALINCCPILQLGLCVCDYANYGVFVCVSVREYLCVYMCTYYTWMLAVKCAEYTDIDTYV